MEIGPQAEGGVFNEPKKHRPPSPKASRAPIKRRRTR